MTRKAIIIENLADKQIAHYAGLASSAQMDALIAKMNMKSIHFSRANKLSGLAILSDNKDLAFKKAGATLLDAYDSGAEVLVVEDVAVLDMFIEHFSNIEKVIGREMIGLELMSTEDFMTQLSPVAA